MVEVVSPYTQHINTQLSIYYFINILYVNIDFKLLFKTLYTIVN